MLASLAILVRLPAKLLARILVNQPVRLVARLLASLVIHARMPAKLLVRILARSIVRPDAKLPASLIVRITARPVVRFPVSPATPVRVVVSSHASLVILVRQFAKLLARMLANLAVRLVV